MTSLAALQLDAYYPCLRVRNERTRSYKSKPYFPGYLFVNVDLDITGTSTLQWIPGSLGLITFGGTPAVFLMDCFREFATESTRLTAQETKCERVCSLEARL